MNKVIVICMVFLFGVLAGVSGAGSLTDNGNGTVTDSGTHLMWQQGENSSMTWDAALTYCEGLSLATYTDWRLPNHKELTTLVDDTKVVNAINTTMFPGANSSGYWSSTTLPSITSTAFCVDFYYGGPSNPDKTSTHYARCVRGGQ